MEKWVDVDYGWSVILNECKQLPFLYGSALHKVGCWLNSKIISTNCEVGIKLKIFHKMVDGSLQLFLHTASKGFQRIRQFSKRGKMILVCHIRGDLTKQGKPKNLTKPRPKLAMY